MAKSKRVVETGPVGERVAANLAALRNDRGMNQAQLAARMTDIGRPMSGAVVSKTEKLDRRIDVDDLVAFAVALATTPNRLLLAGLSDEPGEIDLAPESARVQTREAWAWATGELPLTLPIHIEAPSWSQGGERTGSLDDDGAIELETGLRKFQRENRPHSDESTSNFSLAMKELDNHPEIIKQAVALVRAMHRDGFSGLDDVLFAAVDLAEFIIKNNMDGT